MVRNLLAKERRHFRIFAAGLLILPILANTLTGAPPAWASCTPSPQQNLYVQILTSRGMDPGPLPAQEAEYVRLLASHGIGSTTGDTCNLAQSAYAILVPISRSRMTLDQVANEITRQSGLSHQQAMWMMDSVFNSFGFPPTCDLAPNKIC